MPSSLSISPFSAPARPSLFGIDRPTIGLLNVGTEEMKGHDEVKEAAAMLTRGEGFIYHGFVEGDDIGKGTVDVVVTEGFTGNIALKTAEGTARQVGTYLRTLKADAARHDRRDVRQGAHRLRRKLDPGRSNGGVFLGLNGIVIKSHGGTDEVGFKAALGLAYEMARSRLLDKIEADLDVPCARSAARPRTASRREGLNLRSIVRGVGSYLPARILTNEELSKTIDTTDEWILQRVGIKQRHIAADGELTSAGRRGGASRPRQCRIGRRPTST